MSKERELIKNTGILAIGTLCSKLFTFFLLPLYTAKLATEDYGSVDVLLTFISLLIPIITMQMGMAVFRYVIEYTGAQDQKEVISTGVLTMLAGVLTAGVLMVVFAQFVTIPYVEIFIPVTLVASASNAILQISRALGHNKNYSMASFLITATSLVINLVLILGFDWTAVSILIAYGMGHVVGITFVVLKERLWSYLSWRCFRRARLRELLAYALPLIPNEIAWWITNASDRFVILMFLGASSNGIYAAANKIPTIYTTLFRVFNMAWMESVSRHINEKDSGDFINGVFDRTLRLMGSLALGIVCVVSLLFPLLFGKNYADAYDHVYILVIAVFFNSLCSMYTGIFTGYKKTRIIAFSAVAGAVVNLIVHFALIGLIGLYAASISTLVSYIAILLVSHFYAVKLVRLNWSKRYLVQLGLMTALTTAGYFLRLNWLNVVILAVLVVWSVWANQKTLKQGCGMIFRRRSGAE